MRGEIVLVPLGDGRFGAVQIVDPATSQIALLATIWDCTPSEDDLRQASPHAQFRVPDARLTAGRATGTCLPVPPVDPACAQVDAPLDALIGAFITTAME